VERASDFFGPESTLLLVVIAVNYTYSIQPQTKKHETVIGRSEGSTMRPDIDLSEHNAGELGVSRLHVALQYNAKNNLLSVSDMKSANGTFINGQKLYPQEVRVLRDGDELRLGRMVLRAFFKHPKND
jgi:pSer/pThr/pTyr-binding forkhead associated (FHA) protein